MFIEKSLKVLGIDSVLTEEFKNQLLKREALSKLLDAPRPYNDYRCNFDGNIYVSQQRMMDRFLLVVDNYVITTDKVEVDQNTWAVGADVTIKANILGVEWQATQHGAAEINIRRNESVPKGDAVEQAKKAAISDGMKKVLSWYGVDAHVFRGDITSILPKRDNQGNATSEQYVKTIQKFNLSTYDFKNGIPILPDHFREYYEKMEWTDGIFRSDVFGNGRQNNLQSHSNSANRSVSKQNKKPENEQQQGSSRNISDPQTVKFASKSQVSLISRLLKEISPQSEVEEQVFSIMKHFGDEFNQYLLKTNIAFKTLETLPMDYASKTITWLQQVKKDRAVAS